MKPKEKLFCRLVADGYSPQDAAARAGYRPFSKHNADKLLQSPDIRKQIESLKDDLVGVSAEAGFRRIAFSSVSDAVKLCLGQAVDVDEMDLFCVQEIKCTEKGIEIKFFDRLRALDRLAEMSGGSGDSATPFYRALAEGARRLNGVDDDGV